jgi:hypothetical protein
LGEEKKKKRKEKKKEMARGLFPRDRGQTHLAGCATLDFCS